MTERRKELWREDSKVDNLVSRTSDELRSAERALAGMMNRVSFAWFLFCSSTNTTVYLPVSEIHTIIHLLNYVN